MKNRFLTRPVIIPALLLVYLVVMAVLGWSNYRAGGISATLYFGGCASGSCASTSSVRSAAAKRNDKALPQTYTPPCRTRDTPRRVLYRR